MVSVKTKLISSMIGGILFNFGTGSVLPLGNLGIYIISYHINTNQNLNTNYAFFILPILTFSMTCFGFIGGIIEAKVECHVYLLNLIIKI